MMWLLVEGVHLYRLLSSATLAEKDPMKIYFITGWILPIPITVTWAVFKNLKNDPTCWNTNHHFLKWMIDGPFLIGLSLCTLIFFYILVMIYRKSKEGSSQQKKLVNSFCSLFPLLGIHYCFSRLLPGDDGDSFWWVYTRMAIENIFDSIQGAAVSVIYCFLNGEVQNELKAVYSGLREKRELKIDANRRRSTFVEMMSIERQESL